MNRLSTFLVILLIGVIVGLITYAFAAAHSLVPVYGEQNSGLVLLLFILTGIVLTGIAYAVWSKP